MHLTRLWKNIESRLDSGLTEWRKRIDDFRQVQAVEKRSRREEWTDDEVFKALLLSVLSAETDWARIEQIKPELKDRFDGFDLKAYAGQRDSYIDEVLVPWFKRREAGSRNQRRNLVNLIDAARKLAAHSRIHGSADSYFTQLMEKYGNDPKQVALCLGVESSQHKLPSLGVPLAAEALKNLGFDVAKPDKQVCRAMRAFRLVEFRRGKNGKYIYRNTRKQLETMTRVEEMAKAAGKPVAYVDNAIWMLRAKSGLRLTDTELAELAGDNPPQQKDPSGLLTLLDSWMKEGDAEEQRETIEYLIRAMDENRPEGYKLFPPELKGKSW